MPRIVGAAQNELIFDDPISGSELGLYFRMPTTTERQGYVNAAVQRKGKKVTMHHAEARMRFGLKILTGVRDGDFVRMQGKDQVPMSSDPSSPNYFSGWREEIEKDCGDLVMALAGQVFDGSPSLVTQDDDDEPDAGAGSEPEEDLSGE